MRQPIGTKFCWLINTRPSFIMPVQNFGESSPQKKFKGQNMQNFKISPDFGRLHSSAANISWTGLDIQSRTSTFCTTVPPALREKSWVNFVPRITEIKRWNCTHLNRFFRETIFRPVKSAAPPNFYTRHRMMFRLFVLLVDTYSLRRFNTRKTAGAILNTLIWLLAMTQLSNSVTWHHSGQSAPGYTWQVSIAT